MSRQYDNIQSAEQFYVELFMCERWSSSTITPSLLDHITSPGEFYNSSHLLCVLATRAAILPAEAQVCFPAT